MPTQSTSLTGRVRAEAGRLGFDAVRIARAGELPDGERYREWLASGFHGEMAYMARDPERRIRTSLPGARAVIVVALNYYTAAQEGQARGPAPTTSDSPTGVVSRYAWGDDYHRVMKDKLGALADFLTAAVPGARAKPCVDTSAVLEKAWAERSGIGWRGKHTNLISQEIGSWIFLGEIVTDADLEPDAEPHPDRCGTCTRCIDVCPTRAIVAPYVLDARLCIAYLTIEHRGVIPEELRPKIGNLIFGCDLCQDVCPWNKFARSTPEQRLFPREGNIAPELIPLLSLTEGEFRERYQGSAILRATRDGFVRNVAIALGNSKDPRAILALTKALEDPSEVVRVHVEWALEQIRKA